MDTSLAEFVAVKSSILLAFGSKSKNAVYSLLGNVLPLSEFSSIDLDDAGLANISRFRRKAASKVSDAEMMSGALRLLPRLSYRGVTSPFWPALGELVLSLPSSCKYSKFAYAANVDDSWLSATTGNRLLLSIVGRAVGADKRGPGYTYVSLSGVWKETLRPLLRNNSFGVEFAVELEARRQEYRAHWVKLLKTSKIACSREAPRCILTPVVVDTHCAGTQDLSSLDMAGVKVRRRYR